jgi:hypothetical protein
MALELTISKRKGLYILLKDNDKWFINTSIFINTLATSSKQALSILFADNPFILIASHNRLKKMVEGGEISNPDVFNQNSGGQNG